MKRKHSTQSDEYEKLILKKNFSTEGILLHDTQSYAIIPLSTRVECWIIATAPS
jgi:hypothetical protein